MMTALTLSNSTMLLLSPFQSQTCYLLSRPHQCRYDLKTRLTLSCHHSYNSRRRSLTNMKASATLASKTASTILSTSAIPIANVKNGGVPLQDLPFKWSEICVEGILKPGHNASTFLCQPNSSTFDPVANFISAVNLHQDCPSSLLRALVNNHPDQEV